MLERTQDEIVEPWNEAGLTASKHNVGELLNIPQLQEREYFVEIDHPAAGTLKYPSGPYKVNNSSPWKTQRAPLLGEHNEEILCTTLGYTREDVIRLSEQGII